MKRIFLLVWLMFTACFVNAQELKFKNGAFKIVQFTDLHIKVGNPASEEALKTMEEVVKLEHPDLIMVTGDMVYSKPGETAMQMILNKLAELKVPFATVFGNHDNEQSTPLTQLYEQIRLTPFCVMPAVNPQKSFDYVLPIRNEAGKPEALLYCFYSHNRSTMPGVGGYQWITFDQIAKYRQESEYYKRTEGKTLPSLAFLHIPLPEYNEAVANTQCVLYGTRMEKAYTPNLNSGLFTAFKEMGDVMGVFCGHDHDNDYAVMYYQVLLAHGRFSGGNTEYNHLRSGARVIVLKEGKRELETWIRQRTGEELYRVTYPYSFMKDNWKMRSSTR